jgi:hypothetical protein
VPLAPDLKPHIDMLRRADRYFSSGECRTVVRSDVEIARENARGGDENPGRLSSGFAQDR